MSVGDPEPNDQIFLGESIKTPPFTTEGRRRVGTLLRQLQDGESIGMPTSRPMPSIGPRCHELRVRDEAANWRIFYRIDPGEIVVIHTIAKTTPKVVIRLCRKQLKDHDAP
jgi:phage-related protein